jgi:NADP-dependent 3-hydroxy acid dehydrogenase YdfG
MILKEEIEKIGEKSIAIIADVSDEKAVETMMKNVAKEFGSLDTCITLLSVYLICFSMNNTGCSR